MASIPSENESADEYGSAPYTSSSSTDELELAAINALTSNGTAAEVMIIQLLRRFFVPIFLPLLTPWIRRIANEQLGLALENPDLLTCIKEDLANEPNTSLPKQLKLQFRNKISLPVFTGKHLLGENNTRIEIALVDALTGDTVNTGTESTAKLKIVSFRVGDNESDDDSWTFQDFQNMILGEKKGKSILQGNTYLQLNEGVCFVDNVSFTRNSKNTKNGKYRLGVGVVDAALMNRVEVATTEAFLMKDARSTYSGKHRDPSLFDNVCHLLKIRYSGRRHQRLKDEKVKTVKDLLTLLYTDLELKASSKHWNDIVNNAQDAKGIFLYLDPSNKQNPGIVLDAKRQLKGLIVGPQRYIPVDQLSDKQKADNQNLVKNVDFKTLLCFEDEMYLEKYLHTDIHFSSTSANQSLGTSESERINGPITPSSHDISKAPDNFQLDESTTQVPILTTQSKTGKETVTFNDEMICSMNGSWGHFSNHRNLESLNGFNFSTATELPAHRYMEPGSSSQATETFLNTCGDMNNFNVSGQWLESLMNDANWMEGFINLSNGQNHFEKAYSDTDVMMMATQTISICTDGARTRWIKVSKLLRRKSVRERISPTEGIQAFKRQRCC